MGKTLNPAFLAARAAFKNEDDIGKLTSLDDKNLNDLNDGATL
jgi:hypothetical protein